MGVLHSPGLRGQPEVGPVGVEAPAPVRRRGHALEIGGGDDLLAEPARAVPVDERGRGLPVDLDAHHGHVAVGHHSGEPPAGLDVGELHRRLTSRFFPTYPSSSVGLGR